MDKPTDPDLIGPDLVARFGEAIAGFDCGPKLGPKLGLAVSGGPDSMAMLLLAHAALEQGFEVATVNHGLRPEAAEECALVVAACEARGIPCSVLSVDLEQGNLQSQARQARYDALLSWAEERSLYAVATAHHANDQAETLLMRLNRGSGLNGLAAIRPQVNFDGFPVPVIRPLLEFTRQQLRSIIEQTGLPVVSDPSNNDDSFDRVRMRKNLDGVDWLDPLGLMQSARYLADAEAMLNSVADNFYASKARREGELIVLPNLEWPDTNARMIVRAAQELGLTVTFGEAMALLRDQLSRQSRANVGGALVEKMDAELRVSREPPRKTG